MLRQRRGTEPEPLAEVTDLPLAVAELAQNEEPIPVGERLQEPGRRGRALLEQTEIDFRHCLVASRYALFQKILKYHRSRSTLKAVQQVGQGGEE
ncbi:MAG: hypothetical protein AB7F22_14125 [Reyranella sp.]|uniref:hypothetical protein n=1 Tax=Reyranella sp. TaxID=1929291 RepID=UPI003D120969